MSKFSNPVRGDEFSASFSSFKREAFRLELLGEYTVPEEAEDFRRFKQGAQQPEVPPHEEWLKFLRSAASEGKRISRVRGIPNPVTPYLQFEVEWGYVHSVAAGEEISAIYIEEHKELLLSVPVTKDFWLFDDQRAYLVEYDFFGRFLGASSIVEDVFESYKKLAADLKRIALPFDALTSKVREQGNLQR